MGVIRQNIRRGNLRGIEKQIRLDTWTIARAVEIPGWVGYILTRIEYDLDRDIGRLRGGPGRRIGHAIRLQPRQSNIWSNPRDGQIDKRFGGRNIRRVYKRPGTWQNLVPFLIKKTIIHQERRRVSPLIRAQRSQQRIVVGLEAISDDFCPICEHTEMLMACRKELIPAGMSPRIATNAKATMPSARTTSTSEKPWSWDLRIGEEKAWGFTGGCKAEDLLCEYWIHRQRIARNRFFVPFLFRLTRPCRGDWGNGDASRLACADGLTLSGEMGPD